MMNSFRKIFPGLASMVGFLALWQLATSWGPLKGGSLPTAIDAVASVFGLITDPSIWVAMGQTLYIALVGLVISIALAIPAGVFIGLSPVAFRSTKLVLDFFKVIPPIVIVPIVILTFGPTSGMGIFLVVFANFFMLTSQTAYGVRDTDSVLLDTLRCYGMGKWDQIRHARIPGALPFIAVGVRISVAASMIVAVVAGLIGGAPSLGHQMMLYQSSGQPGKTFGVVLIFGMMGLAFSRLYSMLQRKFVFWSQA
ncbi:MAG: putative aliphatic sulfonates transport permease protein SsuC [Actinomycetota bacterium]|jgi:ABC-type nitrate/sulfonate/bicarbonate transport system permease component